MQAAKPCGCLTGLIAVRLQSENEQLRLKNRQLTTHLRRSVTSSASGALIHNPMKEQQELHNLRHANMQLHKRLQCQQTEIHRLKSSMMPLMD
eukprot:SAG22_NODE_1552_length_4144_cov_3.503090_4_plen_93_part_00